MTQKDLEAALRESERVRAMAAFQFRNLLGGNPGSFNEVLRLLEKGEHR